MSRQNEPVYVMSCPDRLITPEWNWQIAAVRFEETRNDFLKNIPSKGLQGSWYYTCFPVRGMTGCPLTVERIRVIRKIVQEFRDVEHPKRYERAARVQSLFEKYLEHPPCSLLDNWDGKAPERLQHAQRMFGHLGY